MKRSKGSIKMILILFMLSFVLVFIFYRGLKLKESIDKFGVCVGACPTVNNNHVNSK